MSFQDLPGPLLFAIIPIAAIIQRFRNVPRLKNNFKSYNNLEQVIKMIEKRVQRDEGKRGIAEIIPISNEMINAANEMAKAKKIAIITGFPCLLDYNPPTETDGPLGALALVKALLLMNKEVTLLTDECNEEVVLACSAASNLESYGMDRFKLQSFPPLEKFDLKDEAMLANVGQNVDLVIAIERAGPNHEGKYLTMRGRDMTHLIAPLDILFEPESSDITTESVESRPTSLKTRIKSIGIGDGGNEVGMGKVYDVIVKSNIKNAKDIGCVVPADHLIVCSVSNWGGYALAAAAGLIYTAMDKSLISKEGSNEADRIPSDLVRETLEKFLPTEEEEIKKCSRMIAAGARDGVTSKADLFVDGFPLQESLQVILDIKQII